jgi:hypothetical protein
MPLLPGKKNIGKNTETEMEAGKPKKQALAIALSVARRKPKKMAAGGEVQSPPSHPAGSIADVIMRSKKAHDSDVADIDDNNMEMPSILDDRQDAVMKENYNEDMIDLEQPEDSNEIGHSMEDERDMDLISRIRSRMKARRGY